ncbi:oxysterol-binding protein-related protein 11-like isoform X2 [Schistocerca nitens]|uniref:oxysterol-binding protein-related protein 11-like isoform X2 n=1 Tax=Schistocerca nitens TaxID=7011 RepID=UPI00211825E7|nr:oxysterol-binding protein-related protein 11-like isoform X2 [Schistocerca nitens]
MAHNQRLELTSEKLRHQYEGQLNKYTNVVKGWQYRWFVLNPESGTLNYYLNETEKRQRPRGSVHLAAAVISPSDEDSNTFTVNSASGEMFKLRAADARSRQEWVNRIRAVAEMHTMAIAQSNPPLPPREHISLVHAPAPVSQVQYSLELLDAFATVRDHIHRAEQSCQLMSQEIEELPASGALRHNDEMLLLLKATSVATVNCLRQCLSILEQQQAAASIAANNSKRHPPPNRPNNSHFVSYAEISTNKITVPGANSGALTSVSTTSLESNTSRSGTSASSLPDCVPYRQTGFISYLEAPHEKEGVPETQPWPTNLSSPPPSPPPSPTSVDASLDDYNPDDEVTDNEDLSDGDQDDTEEHKSVILHLLSQLKLGMDLTRVVLPTFILERRSLLEMFADCMGHTAEFVRIPDADTPEARMLAVLEWYLTSFHMGRRSPVAKKPYNPIIGEIFRCSWRLVLPVDEKQTTDNSCNEITVTYIAEQVSHHPPVTAFYVECPSKNICLNASIWTKSNFSGMSIGANMIGEINLYLGVHKEKYTFSLPAVYARSILSVPWVELGGKVTLTSSSGFSANIIFHTKPFYGGKVNVVTSDVKNETGTIICKIQGEWNSHFEFTYPNAATKIIEVNSLDIYKKRVRPIEKQATFESRRMWLKVTEALKNKDIIAATAHKRQLEERQREGERRRSEQGESFPTSFFHQINQSWVYNNTLCKL